MELTGFSARVGSGVFSTGGGDNDVDNVPDGFSARVGSGVFSTGYGVGLQSGPRSPAGFSARVGSGVFST